ncbi:hypothetical protein [Mycobacteroides salmoniphilum]|nr:hypothetical protein [Mycobacteroides salmoniphilum]
MEVEAGMRVMVTTAVRTEIPKIAVTTKVQGRDMPVIWVADEEEARRLGAKAQRLPWPAQYVRPA